MGSAHDYAVSYDVEGIHRMASKLDDMADRLDVLDQSMPEQVEAGVYAPLVSEHVNEAVANVAALILRLRKAAEHLRETADEHDSSEDDNVEEANQISMSPWEVRPQ